MYKEIPTFPEFRPLRLEDRGIIRPLFWRLQPEIDDLCFTNLFIWRDLYDIQISCHNGNICFFCALSTNPEKEYFFPPLNSAANDNILDTLDACLNFMEDRGIKPIIRRASEKFVTTYLNNQTRFLAKQDEKISDYIYKGEDLRTLRGRHYHGQRNYIKRFLKNYPDFSTEYLIPGNIPECLGYCEEWFQTKVNQIEEKQIDHDSKENELLFIRAEIRATKKTLNNLQQLGNIGLAIRIDGRIRAFSVGEKLNEKMALIHIEKADHSYIGLIQYLNQIFCQQVWADCEYINRMEDGGIEGLRKAKMALRPHHMGKKYEL